MAIEFGPLQVAHEGVVKDAAQRKNVGLKPPITRVLTFWGGEYLMGLPTDCSHP